MISHPIIKCNPQSLFDYKTSHLSLSIPRKTSILIPNANLDRKSSKRLVIAEPTWLTTHNLTDSFAPKLKAYKMKISNQLNLVVFFKNIINHLKFLPILICVYNPHHHLICLWLSQNLTNLRLISENDLLSKTYNSLEYL